LVLLTSQAYAITSVTAIQLAPDQVQLIIQDALGAIFWEGEFAGMSQGIVTNLFPVSTPSNCLGTLQDATMTVNGVEVQNCTASQAQVPVTGQTTCYRPNFSLDPGCIMLFAVGQDGEVQAGKKSPVPRFTDNGDGTVTDGLTGLIITKDWNCQAGSTTWDVAINYARNLQDGVCGLMDGSLPGEWRLPNVKESQVMLDFGQSNPALPPHPFDNVLNNGNYWTSTTAVFDGSRAWQLRIGAGLTNHVMKNANRRGFFVR